jgi:hypothetical protein
MRSLKIVIFERTAQNRGEIEFIHDKLSAGFSVSGDRVEISSATYVPCDVAVIMWSPRVGWPDRARAARAVRNLHGGNLLIIETPLLRNVAEWHYRVGFDHVHRAGKFFAPKMPNDRAAAMNLVLAPWKSSEGAIVIAGQLPGDYSLDGTDISEWVVDVATHIEKVVATKGCDTAASVRRVHELAAGEIIAWSRNLPRITRRRSGPSRNLDCLHKRLGG